MTILNLQELEVLLGDLQPFELNQKQLDIINQNDETKLLALDHPYVTIHDITDPTEEMKMKVINSSVLGIILIPNPTTKMVVEAFNKVMTKHPDNDFTMSMDNLLNNLYSKIKDNRFDFQEEKFKYVFQSKRELEYFLNVTDFDKLNKDFQKIFILSTESDGLTMKEENNIGGMLCKFLRHAPDRISIQLDSEGWTHLDTLIEQTNLHCKKRLKKSNVSELTHKMMMQMHDNDRKGRYELSDDGSMIRCVQGHSYEGVNIQYDVVTLEHDLYHGTSPDFYDSIMELGIVPRSRHYVHLSKDIETALNVGKRHSKEKAPIVFVISKDTPLEFFITKNGVFHTNEIPPQYLTLLEE